MEKNIESSKDNRFFMLLEAAMRLPRVKIDRTEFLRRELTNHFKAEIVELSIERNPAYAGISVDHRYLCYSRISSRPCIKRFHTICIYS